MGGGGGGGGPEGNSVLEMSIPGPKVGLIIGKGGETIRQLQVSGWGTNLQACRLEITTLVGWALTIWRVHVVWVVFGNETFCLSIFS